MIFFRGEKENWSRKCPYAGKEVRTQRSYYIMIHIKTQDFLVRCHTESQYHKKYPDFENSLNFVTITLFYAHFFK